MVIGVSLLSCGVALFLLVFLLVLSFGVWFVFVRCLACGFACVGVYAFLICIYTYKE